MMSKGYLALAALATLAAVMPAHANDFWVVTAPAGCVAPAPTCGSDTSSGTQAAPFLTIGHAEAAAVAGFGPGSTIHVAPGIYPGSVSPSQLVKTGSAASPITYLCDVKWSCFIKPTASETNNGAWFVGTGGGTSYSSISAIASTSSNCAGPTTPCALVTLSGAPPYTLTTGQIISISGAPNNTAANGEWAITVVSSTQYTLNTSAAPPTPCPSSCGTFRQGAAGAFTIIDGFDVDGTYPGTGQIWYFGIDNSGFSGIIRNNRIHDIAYVPGANNGSSGGGCITDGSNYYGGSKIQVYNNLIFHCGPKGSKQSRLHGIYVSQPNAKVYNNIVWGVSGLCISSWHSANNQTVVNNTLTDCLDGTINVGAGDVDWPHILTGTPSPGSNVITGISTTAGLTIGMGVHDPTNTSCFNNVSLDLIWITAITPPSQVTVSQNAGGGCPGTSDTLNFGGPNTGTYVANNISLNGGSGGLGSFGSTYANTYTNNAQDSSTTWSFSASALGTETHVNDQTITGACLVHYTANDGNNSDYHLNYGCNAVAAGTSTNAPAYDFDLGPVPAAGSANPDIGAYASNPHPRPQAAYPNWLAPGYSTASHYDVFAPSSSSLQGTNGFGAQTRIGSLAGVGDQWLNGNLTLNWPAGGSGVCAPGSGCLNVQGLYVQGVPITPSPQPNPIVNASMDFDQQLATGGTVYNLTNNATASNTLDGWNAKWNCAASCPSGLSVIQASATPSPPTGFANFLKATITTGSATVAAGDYFIIYQPIEAANTTNYGFGGAGAQPLCFAFYSASSVAGAIIGGAIQNAAQTRSYPFIFAENNTANTWQIYSVCLPGDITGTWVTSGNAEGLRVVFALEAGSTFQTGTVATAGISGLPGSTFVPLAGTPGAWAANNLLGNSSLTQLTKTSAATFSVTGVWLEQSSSQNPFRRNLQFDEVQAVQRYSWRLAEPATGVPTAGSGSMNSTAAALFQIPLPTTMRAAPACTVTAGTFHASPAGAAASGTLAAGATNSVNVANLTMSGITASTAGFATPLLGGSASPTGAVYCSARL